MGQGLRGNDLSSRKYISLASLILMKTLETMEANTGKSVHFEQSSLCENMLLLLPCLKLFLLTFRIKAKHFFMGCNPFKSRSPILITSFPPLSQSLNQPYWNIWITKITHLPNTCYFLISFYLSFYLSLGTLDMNCILSIIPTITPSLSLYLFDVFSHKRVCKLL